MSTLELEHLKHTSSSSNNLSTHSDGSLTLQSLNVTGDLTVDTNTLFVDVSADKVGINNTTPSSYLSSDLVVGDTSGDNAITVVSGSANASGIFFQDTTGVSIVSGVRYQHDINKMGLWTNGSERLSIDTNGYVLKPNTPFFEVHTVPNGFTAGQVTDFTSITSNVGSHWNNTNNRFTAPIAGIYQFNFSVFTARTTSVGDYYWDLRKNLSVVLRAYDAKDASHNRHGQVMGSHAMYMNVNDYVDLHFSIGVTSMEASGSHNRFSGYLVG